MTSSLQAWAELRSERDSAGEQPSGTGGYSLLYAEERIFWGIDEQKSACLLIEIPEHAKAPPSESTRLSSTRVEISITDAGDEPATLQLRLEDDEFEPVFGTFADVVVETLRDLPYEGRVRHVADLLTEWHRFWSVQPGTIEQVGLFGELYFLNAWMTDRGLGVDAWGGGGTGATLRDFTFEDCLVEVKTTRREGSAIHEINGLDQLDPTGDKPLFLFSCRIREVEDGQTVSDLAEAIIGDIEENVKLLNDFRGKIARHGWYPGVEGLASFEVEEERLYRVEGDFPRLTRESLIGGQTPRGVAADRIRYQLDLDGCDEWLVTEKPPFSGVDSG